MYCVGADIHDERDFYGREDLLDALLQGAERHVLLTGFRRTGKTAVLLAMERRALADTRLMPLFTVLQGQRTLDEVRDDMATALRRRQRALGLQLPSLLDLRALPLDVLLQVAQEAAAGVGRGLLLLLDEADTLLRFAEQNPAALSRFRAALPRESEDRVVLTGARSTLRLAEELGMEEPFLLGFARKVLDPVLREDEARALIALERRGGQGAIRLSPVATVDLIRRTGGHPFLLQASCDHLRTHGGDVGRAVSSVVALRASSEAFFADLQRISASEREVLSHLLRGEEVPAKLDVFRRSLVELGVLDGVGHFRVPALAEWLRQTGWRSIPALLTDEAVASGGAADGLAPGDPDEGVLSGGLRYRLVRKLGEGGFGEVVLVRLMDQVGFERLAALKLLREDAGVDLVSRIREEGRLLGQLHHRAIVRVEFPVEIGGRFGLVMEYIPGLDLADLVAMRDRGGLPPPRALIRSAAEVAGALDVAWSRAPEESTRPLRVLHRDIKPANIRLTRDGEVKVLDFGIARALGVGLGSGMDGAGTPAYFAPERKRGLHEHPGSDMYATGLVILQIAIGRLPSFPSQDAQAHDAAVQDALREVPASHAGILPLLAPLLAFHPDQRPTAGAFAEIGQNPDLPGPGLRSWAATTLVDLMETRTQPRAAPGQPLAEEGTLRSWRPAQGSSM